MIAREPHLTKYSAANGGIRPGLDNPLGARALYIFQNGEDTCIVFTALPSGSR